MGNEAYMVYSCTNFTATGHCGHRSCIRWAIAVKMNFCKVLRCAFTKSHSTARVYLLDTPVRTAAKRVELIVKKMAMR